MNWRPSFAIRTAQMKRTAVRELLKWTTQPGMISFAGGLPAPELFPLQMMEEASSNVLRQLGNSALQYGQTEGVSELRDWLVRKYVKAGIAVTRHNVLITSGGQQALDLIGRILLDPGDSVLVENPTYLALLSAWRPAGAAFLPVASDAEGMRIDELHRLMPERPKLIYSVPNFQNPQGTTLALARRKNLAALLVEWEGRLVEDDPYGDLRYDGAPMPSVLALDAAQTADPNERHVIYVGTFSKILVPGLRVGWVVAPEPVVEKLTHAKQSADLHTSTFNQFLVWEIVRTGFLEEHLPILRKSYRQRRDAMIAALETYLDGKLTWTRPEGGMFLLATLPDDVDVTSLLHQALERQVAFVPGVEFHLDGAGAQTLRLCFSGATPDQIEEGIRRLAIAFQEASGASSRRQAPRFPKAHARLEAMAQIGLGYTGGCC